MARLPKPGGDDGDWGDILNDYLSQAHKTDGTLKNDSVGADQLSGAVQSDLDAKLTKSSNLGDLTDAPTARNNLGLGDAATKSMSQVAADPAVTGAIDDKIALAPLPEGVPGRQYGMLLGVIRNYDDGQGWQVINDVGHRPHFIDSVSNDNNQITVNYESAGGQKTGSLIAVPDETLAQNGFFVGGSVAPGYANLKLGQAMPMPSDYIYYDGTNWQSQSGRITVVSFASGILTLQHAAIPQDCAYAASLVPRGPLTAHASTAADAFTTTGMKVEFREAAPPIADYISYNGTAWVSDKGVMTPSFSAGVLTLTHTKSVQPNGAYNVSIEGRGGVLVPNLIGATGAIAPTSIKLEFRDWAGAAITTPSTDMKVFVSRPIAGHLITTPTTDMKLYVSHGGGVRAVNPNVVNTTNYPNSNIWLFGVQERSTY